MLDYPMLDYRPIQFADNPARMHQDAPGSTYIDDLTPDLTIATYSADSTITPARVLPK